MKVTINKNGIIDYICEDNSLHKGGNIFFKYFNDVVSKKIPSCSNCTINWIDFIFEFKYKICLKVYCSNCFFSHEHFKNNSSNNELIFKCNCDLHYNSLNNYCKPCKKYFCRECIKNGSSKELNNNHEIVDLMNIVPSNKDINNLNEIFKTSMKKYEQLIDSIEK